MSPKRKTGRPVGESLGGILAGFDQQIMRTTPPPHELVQKGQPVRGLSGEAGDDLVIVLTDPVEPAPARDDEAPAGEG
jgi:hypothetical protein